MARPREFDIDKAYDKAMEAFWSKGYTATSMADLVKAMELQKGSIYQTFGDKHSLFINALQRYTDASYVEFKEIFADAKSPFNGMKKFLTKTLVKYASSKTLRKGCFATNSLVELGCYDQEVNDILVRQATRIETLLAEEIAKGQDLGEFRNDTDAKVLATSVYVMLSGMMADSKAGFSKNRTKKVAETFLHMLTT